MFSFLRKRPAPVTDAPVKQPPKPKPKVMRSARNEARVTGPADFTKSEEDDIRAALRLEKIYSAGIDRKLALALKALGDISAGVTAPAEVARKVLLQL